MTAYVKENGIWKKSNLSSVKVNGEWKKTNKGFVKVDGVWKRFFSAGNEITSDIGEQTDYVKIVDGEEQTWRLWTWDGAGSDDEATASFNVVTSVSDFHVLLLGMGGPARGDTGSGGGGGGWIEAIVTTDEMPEGTYDFTLGKYYIRPDNVWQHTVNVPSVLTIGDTVFTATRGGEGGVTAGGTQYGGGGSGGTASVTGSISNFTSGSGGKGGTAYGGRGSAGHYSEISGEKVDYCGGGGAGNWSATANTPAYGGYGWDWSLIDPWSGSGGTGGSHGGEPRIGERGRRGLRGGGAGGSGWHSYAYSPGSNGMLMIAYRID